MTFIELLIKFLNTRDTSLLNNADKVISQEILTSVSFEILDWLKLEHKRTLWINEGKKIKHKPLKLDLGTPWSETLTYLINNSELFSQYLMIVDSSVVLSSKLSSQEIADIRRQAFDLYNPIKIIN